MKIAYVVPMTWACGGIIVPFHHANELAARGHEVMVYCPPGSDAAWFPLSAPLKPFPDVPLAVPADIAVYVGASFKLTGAIESRCQVVLVQGKDHLWMAARDRAAYLEALARPAFRILAVSKWLSEWTAELTGRDADAVVGNGVDTDRFHPAAEPNATPRILIEGNLPDANKNVIDAVEAVQLVRQYHDVEAWGLGRRFVPPGSMLTRVHVDPPREEIPALYRACDILLKTSLVEGFGLPHLEAMASGCVPITYASGGVLDFCSHGENALVAGVGNLPRLVELVLQFLSDDGLRRRLREGAIETARRRSWKHVGAELESALLRILEGT